MRQCPRPQTRSNIVARPFVRAQESRRRRGVSPADSLIATPLRHGDRSPAACSMPGWWFRSPTPALRALTAVPGGHGSVAHRTATGVQFGSPVDDNPAACVIVAKRTRCLCIDAAPASGESRPRRLDMQQTGDSSRCPRCRLTRAHMDGLGAGQATQIAADARRSRPDQPWVIVVHQ
jgi:hypothetical protein